MGGTGGSEIGGICRSSLSESKCADKSGTWLPPLITGQLEAGAALATESPTCTLAEWNAMIAANRDAQVSAQRGLLVKSQTCVKDGELYVPDGVTEIEGKAFMGAKQDSQTRNRMNDACRDGDPRNPNDANTKTCMDTDPTNNDSQWRFKS